MFSARFIKLFFLLTVMFILPFYANAQQIATDWLEKYPKAKEALQAKQLDKANLLLIEIGKKAALNGNTEEAVGAFLKAIEVNEQIGNQNAIAYCYGQIGEAYGQGDENKNAIKWYKKALELRQEMGDEQAVLSIALHMARVQKLSGDTKDAIEYAELAFKIAEKNNDNSGLLSLHKFLSECYEERKKKEKALYHQKAYFTLFRLLESQDKQQLEKKAATASSAMALQQHQLKQTSKQLDSLSTANKLVQQETEEKQKEIQLLNQQQRIKELELLEKESSLKAKDVMMKAFVGGIGALLIAGSMLTFSLRQSQKAKGQLQSQNLLISKKNEEISAQRDQLYSQSKQLGEAMSKLNASLTYAKRIQMAMLPEFNSLKECFDDAFVLFQPREPVSGDFIWQATVENCQYLAVADCTGHGVPGSLMTMLGTSLLEQAIDSCESKRPDCILNAVNTNLRKLLKQDRTQINDGMDISLICYDTATQNLYFSGAKNPMLVLRANGSNEVIKGDKFPIGGHYYDPDRSFSLHSFKVDEPMTVYLYSDGFQDQFGGPDNKKYMSKRFREMLCSSAQDEMQEQALKLKGELAKWTQKGNIKQVDDITVVGIKIIA